MSGRWKKWPWTDWFSYLALAGWMYVWIMISIGYEVAFYVVLWVVITVVIFHHPLELLWDKIDPSHAELERLKAEMIAIRKDSIERDLRRG